MLYKRKQTRLSTWDYTSSKSYFVTFCVHNKYCMLGRIYGEGEEAHIKLSSLGKLCSQCAKDTFDRFPIAQLEAFCIMPNHVHALITLTKPNNCITLGKIVGSWKSSVTRMAHVQGFEGRIWQYDFHDHIIRDEKDKRHILDYIKNNPKNWLDDNLYERYE